MSTLIVDDLITTLTQEITLDEKAIIAAIRPKLVISNDPAGTFTLSVKQGSTTLVSKSYTMAEIKTNCGFADNEHHLGFFKFEFDDVVVLHPGTYNIELSASGYTFNSNAFVAWEREYLGPTNTNLSEEIISDYQRPLSLQIWSYKYGN